MNKLLLRPDFSPNYYLGLLILGFFFLFSCTKQNQSTQLMPKHIGSYLTEWAIIDSLENEGLYKTALEKVEQVSIKAHKDKNSPQVIKSLLFKGKYSVFTGEEGIVTAIELFETECTTATEPEKSVLHSILGELYTTYLNNQSYEIQKRTKIEGDKNVDMRTWTTERLEQTAFQHYIKSTENVEFLSAIPVEAYQDILSENVVDSLSALIRPTLFDFLVHRALSYFENESNYLTEPSNRFFLDNPLALAEVETFVNARFESVDTTSRKLVALRTFQRLLKQHLKDTDPSSLVVNDLMRLKFVYNNIVLSESEKRELYRGVLNELEKKYSKYPVGTEVLYELANSYIMTGNDYNPENGQKAGEKDLDYAMDYLDLAIKRFPNSIGGSQCSSLKQQMESPAIDIRAEQVYLPNEANLALLTWKNLTQVHWKIHSITDNDAQKYNDTDYGDRWEFLNKLPEIKAAKNLTLQEKTDYRQHSTEIKIDALPIGKYVLLVSPNANFSNKTTPAAFVFFQNSRLSAIELQEENNPMFAVVDRKTGQPLEGVQTIFYYQDWDRLSRKNKQVEVATVPTDKNGFAKMPADSKQRSLLAKFKSGQDELDLNSYLYANRSYEVKKRQEAVFFTDRAIYRPGQTIYFKALLVERDEKNVPSILANQVVDVFFYDVNGQEKGKLTLRSNDYGSVNGNFTAPSSGLTGQMSLRANGPNGSVYFNVEEYKRPKFEVSLEVPAQSVRVGEEVKITGKAIAFAGSVVDGAKVQYRVQRTARMPWWWGWCGWRSPWWASRSAEIKNGTIETAADGTFEIVFIAEPDREIPAEDKPEFNYEISAEVTDITGETQRSTTSTTVGYVALKADLALQEQISIQALQKMNLRMTDLNGKAIAAKGKITVQPVLKPKKEFKKRYWAKPDYWLLGKAEYASSFPDFAYKNEDEPMEWPRQDISWETDFATPKDSILDLSKGKIKAGAAYLIRMETSDAYGNPLKIERVVEVFDAEDHASQIQAGSTLFFEKNTYEPRETAKLHFGVAFADQPVLLWYASLTNNSGFVWKNPNKLGSESIAIQEADRGNLRATSIYVHENRVYGAYSAAAQVPWTNKDLTIEYGTFRDKLYPGQAEEWRIKVSGAKKDAVAAEMVAAMYDASLDQFSNQSWTRTFFPNNGPSGQIGYQVGFSMNYGEGFGPKDQSYLDVLNRNYKELNWFNFPFYGNMPMVTARMAGADRRMAKASAPPMESDALMEIAVAADGVPDVYEGVANSIDEDSVDSATDAQVEMVKPEPNSVRTNLKETVFFFPNLQTDANGDIIVKFTMNEALTRWKFLAFAHTKDMAYGFSEKSVVTQKDLMVLPNAPRFFREGDQMQFAAKVSNLSKETQNGTATLELFDAISMQPVLAAYGLSEKTMQVNFSAKPGQSDLLTWNIDVPKDGTGALVWRVVAKSGQFSDGEEAALPVVTNRTLVTETLPLAVRGNQEKTFELEYLRDYTSTSLTHHGYSLEFTSNPAWYAVQAMPYLMEYPYQCSEQVFSRLYANSLASHVANRYPQIRRVYDSWKGTDAMKSNLSKNQELKTALLAETPWVMDAQSEEQQKQQIALLFDLNKMADEQAQAITQLAERQDNSGGFPWFPGGRSSWYITQHIAEGFGHLAHLGVELPAAQSIQQNALRFCASEFKQHYTDLAKEVKRGNTKWEDDHLDNMVAHYLYTRSFEEFGQEEQRSKQAFDDAKELDYFLGQAEKFWKTRSLYTQAQLALALHRFGKTATAQQIVRSLKERSIQKEELGMYWAFDYGYYFYEMPVETQALMVEVFDEVAQDKAAVDELRIWLLKNKQTNHWKTTKATTEAVYALLLGGENWLENSKIVSVKVGKMDISPKANEAGTAYFKKTFSAPEVSKEMAKVTVNNPNKTIAWGAAYWQYFEDLDKVKDFQATPLTIKKELFLEKNTASGPTLTKIEPNASLETGDRIKVRIEIRVDRAMEYVHLKDMRAATFEPINVLSGYRWQDGLGYYESTGDLATNFFMDYLPKGTFVFEYPLVATQKGDFSNGITTMQCMYAPEFTSHSKGIRVSVK